MSWARIDDQIAFHAKTIAAGNEAFGAWVRMLAHCCAYGTGGFVDDSVARSIASPRSLRRLVEVGFLELDDGGYRVHDFAHWNPTAASVQEKRAAVSNVRSEAGRKGAAARWSKDGSRDGKTGSKQPSGNMANGSQLPSGSDGNAMAPNQYPSPYPDPSDQITKRDLSRLPQHPHEDGTGGEAFSAWCDGVRSVTGQPFLRPAGTALHRVVGAIVSFGPEPDKRAEWAREMGAAWARKRVEDGREINPYNFADWLNTPKPSEPTPAAPKPPTEPEDPGVPCPPEVRDAFRAHLAASAKPSRVWRDRDDGAQEASAATTLRQDERSEPGTMVGGFTEPNGRPDANATEGE